MPGVTGGRKGAGPLKLQSVSASRGTGAAWKEAHLGAHEEQSSRSHRRMTVERTSIFATTLLPSRGVAGTGGLSGALPHVRVEQGTRCGHNAREVPPLVAALARQKRCAEPVRGGDSHRRKTVEPLLGSARSRRHALSGACTCAARQPASSPRGGGTRSRRRGFVTLHRSTRKRCSSWWVPVRRRIAEVGRTPSGSEKRAIGFGRVESPPATKRRVNGSLTTGDAQARKRRGPPVAKGGRFIEARRSSSRERRANR